ncbi:glycerophosphocholine phosphodiesterase GPCPD1-like [Teleopsis dalmanni]|uniref:glycerophosphocholine phosphodiesterase GPCPD1-like n=1 Tax=Teleopsis dalmanni TaxID=139649 RepID=UPI0018CEA0D7|nr:glycerophosphocholine phosphodiesterase GPCPD1-like [Teleopsis dalmanni]XP_037930886.1 glycerophosphocholine phosphodiesterase GPCPD1-like [Teleopsis dalmanni]
MFKLNQVKNFARNLLSVNKKLERSPTLTRRPRQERALTRSWLVNNERERQMNFSGVKYASSFRNNVLESQQFGESVADYSDNEYVRANDEPTTSATIFWKFTVRLDIDLQPNERVGLTGETPNLGEWQMDRAVLLFKRDRFTWSTNATLPCCTGVQYRYFIYVQDDDGNKQIRRWETHRKPRMVKPKRSASVLIDRFGEQAANETEVSRGWLTNETIVQFKFDREAMFRISGDTDFNPENIFIKVVPLNKKLEPVFDDNLLSVEVVKMKYGDSVLQMQNTHGIMYKSGDIIIFHITLQNVMCYSFAIQFLSSNKRLLAKAFISPEQLIGSEGVLSLTITKPEFNSIDRIGKLYLPYLIVKPFTDLTLHFATTFSQSWPQSWPKLDVGHRGNGRSYVTDPPPERENTIASFLRAYEENADLIELDVHLTSDGVPVVYHDFGVRTAPAGVTITDAEQLSLVLIKDISYEELKELRVFSLIKDEPVEYLSHNAEQRRTHRVFPKLNEVLEEMPKSLGIDVEIKWPQHTANGGRQARQSIDKNFFVDKVINIVLSHGCDRVLIFSSFDADLCTMLRFKQNLFPILFLTNGETRKWPLYMDLRTRTFEQAINHAQAFELAGTAPHAEDFLGSDGMELMSKANNLGQTTLVWGDDINSKERVKYFYHIGANAICYDRTDLYLPDGKKQSFFKSIVLHETYKPKCVKSK